LKQFERLGRSPLGQKRKRKERKRKEWPRIVIKYDKLGISSAFIISWDSPFANNDDIYDTSPARGALGVLNSEGTSSPSRRRSHKPVLWKRYSSTVLYLFRHDNREEEYSSSAMYDYNAHA